MSNIVMLASMEAESAVRALPAGSDLAARFLAAAKATKHHWLAPNEGDAFLAAVSALYTTADDEEQERILAEAEAIKVLNAMASGVPVDFDAVRMPEDPIGLMQLWRQVA